MQNPFRVAKREERRMKIFLWGEFGTGKTTQALKFPSVACIDLERGSALYGDRFQFHRVESNNLDDLRGIVTFLKSGNHQYQTLLIDPITIVWELFQHQYKEFNPQIWNAIKKQYKNFMNALVDLDLHVIATARQKTKYKPGNFMQYDGETFDSDKSSVYLFDTVIQLYRDEQDRFFGFCSKDRSGRLPSGRFEVSPGLIARKLLGDKR